MEGLTNRNGARALGTSWPVVSSLFVLTKRPSNTAVGSRGGNPAPVRGGEGKVWRGQKEGRQWGSGAERIVHSSEGESAVACMYMGARKPETISPAGSHSSM